ncbi:hypothetical protein AWB71_05072 [Caballeronia peredens]|uniref:DUF4148 domain-containing protein n=1 Tax=Caballeronia novacaledonica TaxID=1544861 RepID=A0AA37IH69_9BURK|nr:MULTISPECIES: DUF4148 domain-containing protein [Caballeronia]MDR5743532.1 DUF4148 domain-containing protein [Caballeronia sp. LZ029]GJH28593.1 DUF4148 domain-containing protein [Caballeronia novacaledonica]SAL75682.1 hypothetical protein AWB71_05072 [Caballeronia peredens]
MKVIPLLVATLSIAFAAPAFAEHAYRLNDVQPTRGSETLAASSSSTQSYGGSTDGVAATGKIGKTRAQVVAEMIQAQRDGLIPTSKNDYPPSERTIERNKELYRIRNR